MSYGLPAHGDLDWDDDVNNSVEALYADVQTAKADAAAARSDAGYAKTAVDAAGLPDIAAAADAAEASAADAASSATTATGAATSAQSNATLAATARTAAEAARDAAEAAQAGVESAVEDAVGPIRDLSDTTFATNLLASTAGIAVSRWKSGATYSVGQPVLDPLGGSIMLTATAHTAGVNFDVTKFTPAPGQPCNLLTYGCRGDDATDDTAAVTTALTTANTLGKWVYAPQGTYRVAGVQVPVPAQLTGLIVQGAGVGRTIFKGAGAASPMFTIGDGGTLDAQHVAMHDLTIDGNNTASEGIRLNKTRFFTMHRGIVRNFTTYCVNIVGGVGMPNYFADFEDVRISNAPIPIYIDGAGGEGGNSNYFTRCHIGGSSNVNYNSAGVAIAVVINAGDANVFRDCEFTAAGTTIYLHNSCVGNKIINNQFDGPTVAVNPASTGVQNTQIMGNSGTVKVVDAGANTLFVGHNSDGSIGPNIFATGGVIVGGPSTATATVPLRVRGVASQTADLLRLDNSAGTFQTRFGIGGDMECAAGGTFHGFTKFDNTLNNSLSVRIETGPSTSGKGLVVKGTVANLTGNLVEYQDSTGTALGSVGPKGQVVLPSFTTANRPSASTSGAGALIYDSTLGRVCQSDGTSWNVLGTRITATATLDFPSVAAAGSQELTITVTGAAVGDNVALGAPAAIEAGLVWNGYVSAANTVKIRVTNVTASPIDPASATWRATVTQ